MDVTEASFGQDVMERSFEVPVVVDFWASWCGPCRSLSPVLERLAVEADGSWVLAKVDVDANPGLSQAFEIRGIPAVRAFKDGRDVGEFVGALPESRVREWLERLGPSKVDLEVAAGAEAEAAGRLEDAAEAYGRALQEVPAHSAARGGLERAELRLRVQSLDESALAARLEADERDVDAGTGLADVHAAGERIESAFDVMLHLVRATEGEDRERARKHLLRLLDTVAPEDPRAVATRRSLSLALF